MQTTFFGAHVNCMLEADIFSEHESLSVRESQPFDVPKLVKTIALAVPLARVVRHKLPRQHELPFPGIDSTSRNHEPF